ncbi:bifunctional DNA-binding transcriptional regulator/O6-methylguanine-DNA methyltransferase Ada [Azospirillum doebereinerae]|uniref:methylated-DNA--[protein]-cysteine S-methyltransferase n=1 Tax=Azospirillum doebereinerae TaxID=92933 RepID=A0A3S0XB15_9PROT|nr:bifunctional DNA-binding transcriptional regulator/O6-methylguanine-DNA methyltransferase Ada [Azospirillum doebereinerae]RUQ70667.1 bifunctional DNA-binding transcriptional regulator/O6-methylguanine-DNA methyltransferase Ada [Azospirillum doebereinerae]
MSTSTAPAPTPAETATERDPRWFRVLARDRSADGEFCYSVATTGVYCRPSCPSRAANPKNVRFHRTAADAEAAGFRPCRRCEPDRPPLRDRHAAGMAAICRRIDEAEETPSLSELAREAGLSPHHFHRVFKAVVGVTPRDYATAGRTRRVHEELARGGSVTEAIYGAGFNSSGRFYEASDAMLGMTPGDYQAGGTNANIRFAVGDCSLGSILVAMSDRGVCAILIGEDPEALLRDLQDRFPHARLIGGDGAFESVVATVVGFVEAPGIGLDLPLDLRGTAFQRRVWQALRAIPPGTTASYAEIAARIGAPKAVRAVAGACAANALAVAIPCHRVVRSDGALSGYRWGIERKRALIEREAEPAPAGMAADHADRVRATARS